MTYHNTLLFSFELTLIYEHLKDFPQLTSVWRVVSGVAQNNGVSFHWQGHQYRINWYQQR